MGKILIIEDVDFSNNPNVISVTGIPVTTETVKCFYSSQGALLDGNNEIIELPSSFTPGPTLKRTASVGAFVMNGTSSFLKGRVVRFQEVNPSPYGARINMNLVLGVSFSFLIRRPTASVAELSNQCLLGLEDIGLQFRSRAKPGDTHFVINYNGSMSNYPLDYSLPASADIITLTITKNKVLFYLNGALRNNINIADIALPDSINRFCLGATWNNSSPANGVQLSQFYIHDKELTLAEVQDLHLKLDFLKK